MFQYGITTRSLQKRSAKQGYLYSFQATEAKGMGIRVNFGQFDNEITNMTWTCNSSYQFSKALGFILLGQLISSKYSNGPTYMTKAKVWI